MCKVRWQVYVLLVVGLLAGCHGRAPSDAELRAWFGQHQSALEQSLPESEFEGKVEALAELGSIGIDFVVKKESRVWFTAYYAGYAGNSVKCGYLYAPELPSHATLVDHTDDATHNGLFVSHLSGAWYIFERSH